MEKQEWFGKFILATVIVSLILLAIAIAKGL